MDDQVGSVVGAGEQGGEGVLLGRLLAALDVAHPPVGVEVGHGQERGGGEKGKGAMLLCF
jgi:hypothetical protein